MIDDPTLFAIVPLPPPGAARDALLRDAIAFGGPDELLRKFFACEATERDLANQQAQTAEVANRIADIGTHLMDMTEALTVRQDKQARLDAKRKRDAAQRAAEDAARTEAAELRDWLDAHPEPSAEPAALLDDGELEIHQPPDKERYGPGAENDAGGVPLSYGETPESYVKGGDELDPPGLGGASEPEPDPEDLGKAGPKPVARSPAAVSFW